MRFLNAITLKRVMSRSVLLLLVCFIFTASVLPVHADPSSETGAWVEVICDPVPEDYEGPVYLDVQNLETKDEYTITCLPGNDYLEREKLPYGSYTVKRTYTTDNFFYNAVCFTSAFKLEEESPTAEAITIEVVKYDIPEEMLAPYIPEEESTDESEGEEEVSEVEPEEPEEAETPSDETEEVTEPETPEEEEPPAEEPVEEETPVVETEAEHEPEEEPSEKESIIKKVKGILISLLSVGIFVGVITLVVFVVRRRMEDDD